MEGDLKPHRSHEISNSANCSTRSRTRFEAVTPIRRTGRWGAFELGVRYSVLDLNFHEGLPGTAPAPEAIRGGEQTVWSIGLNWYPAPAIKLMAAFQDVSVDRLSPGGAAFGAGATPPAGAQVGQDLQIWSLRTQYAF